VLLLLKFIFSKTKQMSFDFDTIFILDFISLLVLKSGCIFVW